MSFITFAKTALGDELAALGFERKRGVDWFKLIDDCIWLRFRLRKVAVGLCELHFGMQSLFSKLWSDDEEPKSYTELQFNAGFQYFERERAKGVERIYMHPIYEDENTDDGKASIAHVRGIFAVIAPVLASVSDLSSCKRAIELADYMTQYPHLTHELDSELEQKGFTAWPPEDVFFILCKQGKYGEAAAYLKRDIIYHGEHMTRIHGSENGNEQMEYEKKRVTPYIEMIERGETDKIEQIMRENYIRNCDLIESIFKIEIDRSKALRDLE